MDLFNQLGDIWGKSRASNLLGELFLRQGNYEMAQFFLEQNLKFEEEIQFKSGIVLALSALGDLHRYQGDYIQAKRYYERNVDVSRTYGMKEDWGLGLYFLGLTALHQNNYAAAKQHFAEHFKAERESLDKVNVILLVHSCRDKSI
jgi:tetratricopeptide (TPR) repeat protein